MAAPNLLQLVNGVVTEVAAVQTSAGAGSAGKVVALNASGLVDSTMLPTSGSGTSLGLVLAVHKGLACTV